MNQSYQKKTLLVIVLTVLLISSATIIYFGGVIKQLQDEQCQLRAEELANTASASIDHYALKRFKEAVRTIYDTAKDPVSNDQMGTEAFASYIAQFAEVERMPEYQMLLQDLREQLEASGAESLYLFYLDPATEAVVYLVDAGYAVICPPGSFDYLRGEELNAITDPERSLSLSISNPDIYGDIVAQGEPVHDTNGTVIGYMGVDISMAELTNQRNRILVNTILTILVITLLIGAVSLFFSGRLLMRPIKLTKELSKEAEQLKKENQILAKQIREEQKISELADSITSLLTNMPVLSFSKDVISGKYLACNQLFAQYANKPSPAEVVGHIDAELFDAATAAHFVKDDKIAFSMDQPYIFQEQVLDAVGAAHTFQTRKFKFKDSSGRLCLLGMSMDVSEIEQIRRETMTYSRIARALAEDYNFVYYVDLRDDSFMEYTSESGHTDLEVERSGKDFFRLSRTNAKKLLYKDDQERFIQEFTKENVTTSIRKNNQFVITYRMLLNGSPTYVNLKAVSPEDDTDHIIVGINNVDIQMRAREQAERIKEEQLTYERITALSGHYICIYTVDPETEDFIEYTATNEYSDLTLPKQGKDFFADARANSARVVYKEDLDWVLQELDKNNVLSAIKNVGVFSIDYRLVLNGRPNFVNLKAVLIEEKDGPQLIVGVSDIDARVRREEEHAKKLRAAKEQADIDSLTGIKNKHAYTAAEEKLNSRIQSGEPLRFGVAVCDVNGLKQINDTLGHQAGDELIRSASALLTKTFRPAEVFRVGGDEFTVIVTDAALLEIDQILRHMEESNARHKESGKVVIACGYAGFSTGNKTVADVFERADMAMYENKRRLKAD